MLSYHVCQVATALIMAFIATAPPAQSADESPVVQRATSILKLFLDNKFDEFVATGNANVQAHFPATMAKTTKTQFDAMFGRFERIAQATPSKVGQMDAVTFKLLYEHNKVTMVVTLDGDGKMAGFRMTAMEPRANYQDPDYVDRSKFREEKIVVATGKFELPGTLSMPTGVGPFPGLVLVHGSGPHDEDESVLANKPFRDLALGLASRGVAVVRYEKRTHKYGGAIDPAKVTLEWETIDDALAAARLLRKRSEIDSHRVYVLGHSLGGMAAPFIAQRDPKIAGIVILAGNARPLVDLLHEQLEYIANTDGQVTEDEAKMIDQTDQGIAKIRAGQTDNPQELLLGAPLSYWADLNRRDQVGVTRKLDCRILVIQGGRDYQVTKKCFQAWQTGLRGKRNVTFKLYDSLNHLMITGNRPSTPEEYNEAGHVDQQVVQDIAAWITAK